MIWTICPCVWTKESWVTRPTPRRGETHRVTPTKVLVCQALLSFRLLKNTTLPGGRVSKTSTILTHVAISFIDWKKVASCSSTGVSQPSYTQWLRGGVPCTTAFSTNKFKAARCVGCLLGDTFCYFCPPFLCTPPGKHPKNCLCCQVSHQRCLTDTNTDWCVGYHHQSLSCVRVSPEQGSWSDLKALADESARSVFFIHIVPSHYFVWIAGPSFLFVVCA